MTEQVRIRPGFLEQQRNGQTFQLRLDDLQTRLTYTDRVVVTLPTQPVDIPAAGTRVLVTSNGKKAGLWSSTGSGFIRPEDAGMGTHIRTALLVQEPTTGRLFRISGGLIGDGETPGREGDDLTVTEPITAVGSTPSQIAVSQLMVSKQDIPADPAGVRYLVDSGTSDPDNGPWIATADGPVRPPDFLRAFDSVAVDILYGPQAGGTYVVRSTGAQVAPGEDGFAATVERVTTVSDIGQATYPVNYVVQSMGGAVDYPSLVAAAGAQSVTVGETVLVLHNVTTGHLNGVWEFAANSAVRRPVWWGGLDTTAGLNVGADSMYPVVVQEVGQGRFYVNTAVGLVDREASAWVPLTLADNYVFRTVYATSQTDAAQFPTQAQMSYPDFVLVLDQTVLKLYRYADGGVWQVVSNTASLYYTAFLVLATDGDPTINSAISVGDVYTFSGPSNVLQKAGAPFSEDPLVLRCPRESHTVSDGALVVRGGLGVLSTIRCTRARVHSSEESSSRTTGALTVAGGVGVSGDVHANSLLIDSDERLKENLSVIDDAESLDMVVQGLTPHRFNYINEVRPRIGLIAQQVRRVAPECVKESPDTGYLSVDYNELVGVLAGGIRELKRRLDAVTGGDGKRARV